MKILKWLGIILLSLLILMVLFCGYVYLSSPGPRGSVQGTLLREGMTYYLKKQAEKGENLFDALAQGKGESLWAVPEGYTLSKQDVAGVPVEVLDKVGGEKTRAILFLHGGGYIVPLLDKHRTNAMNYANSTENTTIFLLDYRVAPDNHFPAALEDAQKAWNWILERGFKPENIAVVGDSAGGNLTLAITTALKMEGKPLPGALVVMSPLTDVTGSGASHTSNVDKDFLAAYTSSAPKSEEAQKKAYMYGADPKDPLVSPLFADLSGFPPMLIQVGSHEVLLDDSVMLHNKAKEAGVNSILHVYSGMYHTFQWTAFLPETKEAWKEVKNFFATEWK